MPEDPTYRDKDLLLSIAEGDHVAFGQLMDKYWNSIYSQAIAYLKDSFKAKDLVQDVFLTIWKDRHKLREVESPQDYLFIIARNKIFNEARKRIMLPLLDNLHEHYTEKYTQPDHLVAAREVSALIRTAILQLPPQRRKIFELSRDEGLTYEAIAQLLGISRETVKVQMVKALSFLRRFIYDRLPPMILFLFFLRNE